MTISIFELMSIGVGPSSSHTVGPMRAAGAFAQECLKIKQLKSTHRVRVELYGSLALTGVGHCTDKAIVNGLAGFRPESIEPDTVAPRFLTIKREKTLLLMGEHTIAFDVDHDLIFLRDQTLPKHSNAVRFTAYDKNNSIVLSQVYYSIGGGFIVTDESYDQKPATTDVPYPFSSAHELLTLCHRHQLSIPQLMMENEKTWRSEKQIREGILRIATVMRQSIDRGCATSGILPGGLNVKRRAHIVFSKLQSSHQHTTSNDADGIHRLQCYALAVNEENAAGGRIVTAPTNGAAGVIPAVLCYAIDCHPNVDDQKIINFLLTAAAIAILYKKGASISAAEVGCQGEIGVACSMAAGALAAILGGTLEQIENAAEIGMEHHLGLTCDPIDGLVQIPCIERNALGAVQAVASAKLALMGDGKHHVSLDKVIATMLKTGHDMQTIYKETSLGGLAASHPEC